MGTWNKPPNKSPWEKGPQPPDIDELLNNLQDKFKIGLPKKGALSYIIILAIIVWLATGIFIIDPEEQGVIKRFGAVRSGWTGTALSFTISDRNRPDCSCNCSAET